MKSPRGYEYGWHEAIPISIYSVATSVISDRTTHPSQALPDPGADREGITNLRCSTRYFLVATFWIAFAHHYFIFCTTDS